MTDDINSLYGNRVRVRVCGVAIRNDAILLVKHAGIGPRNTLWAPPGGGVEPGETAAEALRREFSEETGLQAEVKDFLFVNEVIIPPLHAVELFFQVDASSSTPYHGSDPEMPPEKQIIKEVRFVTFQELGIMDEEILHNALHSVNDPKSLLNMKGYFKFCQ